MNEVIKEFTKMYIDGSACDCCKYGNGVNCENKYQECEKRISELILPKLKQENEELQDHCKRIDETNKILYKEKCELIDKLENKEQKIKNRLKWLKKALKDKENQDETMQIKIRSQITLCESILEGY